MRRAALPLLLVAALASGCVQGVSGRGAVPEDGLLPPGTAKGPGVDPLIVGDRLLAAGEPELALESYIRAGIEGDGLTPEVQLAMATANIELGRLGQAEAQLRTLVAAEPRNARALNNLGVVLLEQGETGEAHRVFKTAFALQPSPEIRENLRVSSSRMVIPVYDDGQDDTFTLTRRTNGTWGLSPPRGG
ncbi:tetratricopeptide repeat protein [uncultured Jannaschia sp.]|uniref:tetratricopeptide repeat protein n=1 Tax=uncultured Jannaschia sp. TaxID=293347 RepID=UPI002606A50F|nr:tetratricopeptide repeat protein [uncultured Jannaschia sp.]